MVEQNWLESRFLYGVVLFHHFDGTSYDIFGMRSQEERGEEPKQVERVRGN